MARRRKLKQACGLVGVASGVAATAGLIDPLASMASYTAALMMLNQITPPLLLLAIPARAHGGGTASSWVRDPLVAFAVFSLVTVAVSLPAIFDAAVANALFSLPVGLIELGAGLLLWRLLITGGRWEGLIGIAAGLPMTVVAVVWMVSPSLLYTPYVETLCIWNVPPLQDQRWAGFAMLLAGLPMQFRSFWLVLEPLSPRSRDVVRT